MTNQSILPPEMNGVMSITGFRGIGKSFLAAQADLPENILFLDFESKGAGIDAQLKFGSYRALTQEAGEDPQELYRATMEAIDSIPDIGTDIPTRGKFTVAILDNVSPFELALNAEAANNAEMYSKRYGLNLKNVKAGRFGGTKAIVNFMISDICAKLHSKGVRLIITTAHISARWSTGGPIPNKYNVKGADRWQELSILSLILIPGDKPPVPSALVQKEQLGTISIDREYDVDAIMRGEKGHIIARRLPPKMSECTFQKLRWYLYNPADFDNLKDEEIPSLEERDPFDKGLNKEQLGYVTAMLDAKEREAKEEDALAKALGELEVSTITSAIIAQIKDVDGWDTMTPPAIAKAINGTIPDVAKALQAIKNGA